MRELHGFPTIIIDHNKYKFKKSAIKNLTEVIEKEILMLLDS